MPPPQLSSLLRHCPSLLSDDTEGNSELDEDGANADDDMVICEWGALQSREPEKFCLCRQPEDGR